MNRFLQLLDHTNVVLLDGAMGTMLMALGLEKGSVPEMWNVEHPEFVKSVHQDYIDAGSQVILTNSFGGNRKRLAKHHLENRSTELNLASAKIACGVAEVSSKLVAVGGSIGPLGELLKPYGSIEFEEALDIFAEQASALEKGGVDVIWIETMADLKEVKAAVDASHEVCRLPICVTLSFDSKGHTMMGVSPEEAVDNLKDLGLVCMGANCGKGPDELEEVIQKMKQKDSGIPLVAKANAGIPRLINDQIKYDGTPELMAEYAIRVKNKGARLIGACCGSSPNHIRAMQKALCE